ncbi:MAG: GH116 family glycosyl hydrolase, partial [Gemmatimonadales bacterium]
VLGAAGMASLPVTDAPAGEHHPPGTALPHPRYDGTYAGPRLNRVAFPMGGMGAGMICLEGTGALSEISIRHHPDVYNEPCVFAAVSVLGPTKVTRILEGPVPGWKIFGAHGSAQGDGGASYGLPRFGHATFKARFPFGTVSLTDPSVPLAVQITGWSPFIPGDADSASLPVAALEYHFTNSARHQIKAIFSYNARNFLPLDGDDRHGVRTTPGGFTLWSAGPAAELWRDAAVVIAVDDPGVRVNAAWFRGGWYDPLTMAWKEIEAGASDDRPAITDGEPSPGGTLSVPFDLAPGASRTITLRLAWYVGHTKLRIGTDPPLAPPPAAEDRFYRPWYAGRFAGIDDVAAFWRDQYADLRNRTAGFTACFYDTTLPSEVIEAVSANLAILKSPTVLRQTDGRLWAYEGCADNTGCCHGSCTHVWNYAQAIPHLFPALERTLRETEFGPSQDERGHQQFRAALPIRPQVHDFHAAADGQLGGIMKVHREWRISGDTAWLRSIWPRVRASLDFGIRTWDPDHKGWVEEPHHNTYDIELWGPDGFGTSFYLGALRAAVLMGTALNDDVSEYAALLATGASRAGQELFNGEYFIQKVEWKTLRASRADDKNDRYGLNSYSPEARALFDLEGPKYQYGSGCLSDGVIGSWMALVTGVGQVLPRKTVASHLASVHRYNLVKDLSSHANPQRPSFAVGKEGGLLLCSWPRGGAPSLPFPYSDEVWTGIEYQVASHLMLMGLAKEGLDVVRTCRDRYDGRVRNPFDEYECGHWYARALSSYALLQGLSGARYDAVERVLHLQPNIAGDFRAFLSTATGFGTVGVRGGKPFLETKSGKIEVREIKYSAA